ncbi:hypothetical protein [Curtobacterium flaccumfaciens]|uniref:hypothetical protein n=1 Tax=Curtobacterium flaccumfaciens TaxID=2035 RepID=UPI001BDF0514|nr:hypothetical protein [Curtobacterium flaccumfaciens]MBT1630454.1 hypothetical protein [Curtobacterium flaccumfaciens pv. oortii]MCX2843933.1 hypothetical protein [Curtobacterium flaccumfaciens pv. oortii]
MPKVILGRSITDQAAASPAVRRAIRDKADRILPRAQRLAYAAGAKAFGDSLRVEEGTRPGTKSSGGYKRPFARVIATSADATAVEHGDVGVSKQAILRRAMGA